MTDHLDEQTALRLGGWDARFIRVLLVAEHGDLAIALLDAAGDLNLDDFARDEAGAWRSGGASGSVSDGPGMQGDVVYDFGRAEPGSTVVISYLDGTCEVVVGTDGWWGFVAPADRAHPDALPRRELKRL